MNILEEVTKTFCNIISDDPGEWDMLESDEKRNAMEAMQQALLTLASCLEDYPDSDECIVKLRIIIDEDNDTK